MGIILQAEQLSYNYHGLTGETHALKDVSFDVEEGEFVAVVGPSGCGKTTLLSIIAGLEKPDSGEIRLSGENVRIGYMLQKDHLLEWRTTKKNIMLGLEIRGRITKEEEERAQSLMETYGLGQFAEAKPSELSGGMRQRAALIRTLLMKPDILLLDEPFSALDYQTRLAVSDDIWRIIRRERKTALLITHDISEAVSMADRIIILSARPGTVKEVMPVSFASMKDRTPFLARSAPEFKEYFQLIWDRLDGGSQRQEV